MKGQVAEDLYNREMTYPIVIALDAPGGHWVTAALSTPSRRSIRNALNVIQGPFVRDICMAELEMSGASVREWLAIWKRNEKLDLKS
jgi:geranylgeranyldiphosphate transferase